MTDDEKRPMSIGEFHDKVRELITSLGDLLDNFDDNTDPAGITQAIVATYLAYCLDPDALGKEKE